MQVNPQNSSMKEALWHQHSNPISEKSSNNDQTYLCPTGQSGRREIQVTNALYLLRYEVTRRRGDTLMKSRPVDMHESIRDHVMSDHHQSETEVTGCQNVVNQPDETQIWDHTKKVLSPLLLKSYKNQEMKSESPIPETRSNQGEALFQDQRQLKTYPWR